MVAQAYAETCMFQENTERAQQAPSFDTVGENRAFGRSTNYTDLIERGWFAQRANFDFDNNMCFTQGVCDEYTQVLNHSMNHACMVVRIQEIIVSRKVSRNSVTITIKMNVPI